MDQLWITDDILQNTFDRFCNSIWSSPACTAQSHNASHRATHSGRAVDDTPGVVGRKSLGSLCFSRRGSNVPGPLEANKRLARRRINNTHARKQALASPSQGGENLLSWLGRFSAPFAQRREPEWSWEPPAPRLRSAQAEHSYPDLPTWMTEEAALSADNTSVLDVIVDKVDSSLPARLSIPEHVLETDHTERAATVADLTSQNIDTHKVDAMFQNTASASEAAFQVLLQKHAPCSDLLDFLKDVRLNTSSCVNVIALLLYFKHKSLDTGDFGGVLSYIRCGLLEGTIASSSFITILRLLPDLAKAAYGSQDSELIYQPCVELWNCAATAMTEVSDQWTRTQRRDLLNILRCAAPGRGTAAALANAIISIVPAHPELVDNGLWLLFARCTGTLLRCAWKDVGVSSVVPSTWAIVRVLNSLPTPFAAEWIIMITSILIDDASDASYNALSQTMGRSELISAWLRAIRHCNHLHPSHNDLAWYSIYQSLSRVMKPNDLASHFAALSHRDILWILVQHWLPKHLVTTKASFKAIFGPRPTESGEASLDLLQRAKPPDIQCCTTATDIFKQMNYGETHHGLPYKNYGMTKEAVQRIVLTATAEKPLQVCIEEEIVECEKELAHSAHWNGTQFTKVSPYVALLMALCRYRQSYAKELETVLSLLFALNRFFEFEGLARAARRILKIKLPSMMIRRYVQAVSELLPASAYRVLKLHHEVYLSHVPRLPINLIRTAPRIRPTMVYRMLFFPDKLARLPAKLRIHGPTCSFSSEHVDLVNKMAKAFAKARHLSPRQAFRYASRCYRYLQDGHAPLSGDISTALVISGIAKDIVAGRRVSTMKIRFILSLVRRIEGKEVADAVDRVAWQHRMDFAETAPARRRGVPPVSHSAGWLRQPSRFG